MYSLMLLFGCGVDFIYIEFFFFVFSNLLSLSKELSVTFTVLKIGS